MDISPDKKPTKKMAIILLAVLCLAILTGAAFVVRAGIEKAKTIADVFGVDIIIIPKTAAGYAAKFVVADVEKPLYLPPGTYEQLSNDPAVARLTYHIHLGKPPADCCTFIDGPIIAFAEKNDFILAPLVAQRRKKGPLAQHEVLEGASIHDYLGLVTDILLFNNNIKITGYLQHSGTNFDNCIFMPVADIATISSEYLPDYPAGGVSVIFMQLNPGVDGKEFRARIQQSYPGIATISKGSFWQGVKDVVFRTPHISHL